MYARVARKTWLNFARSRKRGAKIIRRAIKKQLQFLRRDLHYLQDLLSTGYAMSAKQSRVLQTIEAIYNQQKEMSDKRSHKAADRIVSFSQSHVRPIVRGKAKSPVEFGVKLDLSVVEGLCRVEYMSFDAYNESAILKIAVERYRQREGCYPQRLLADKIYRNRENLNYCKERRIKLLGPALRRPRKDAEQSKNKEQEYRDNADRIEVERKFGQCKQSFGLGLITAKLAETTFSSVLWSVIAMNIDKLAKAFLSQNFLGAFAVLFSDCRGFFSLPLPDDFACDA